MTAQEGFSPGATRSYSYERTRQGDVRLLMPTAYDAWLCPSCGKLLEKAGRIDATGRRFHTRLPSDCDQMLVPVRVTLEPVVPRPRSGLRVVP